MLKSASRETGQIYETIRDQLLAEGFAKGAAKGKLEGKLEGRAEGKAEATAQLLVRVQDTRGIELSEILRVRVEECRDESLLQRWFERALHATALREVFDD